MKRQALRTKSVGTKVSEAEFAVLEKRAHSAGLTLSEWTRDALLAAPVEPDAHADEVILAELLAFRSLFLNLQFRADKRPLDKNELNGLIDRADETKIERARERLQAAHAAQHSNRAESTSKPSGEGAWHGGMGT
jgi:hypothetical protein